MQKWVQTRNSILKIDLKKRKQKIPDPPGILRLRFKSTEVKERNPKHCSLNPRPCGAGESDCDKN
jgi:hypothetical protein